jgi:hypothetical protein
LYLESNQLTGEIPEEICNQGDNTPDVGDNQLCPPYPSCISQNDQDSQDTSECPISSVCGYDDFEYLSGCGAINQGCNAYGVEGLPVIADGYCELVGYTSAVSYDVITTGPVQNVLNMGCDYFEGIYYSCENVGYCNETNPGVWGVSESWPVLTNLVCE